MSEEEPHEETDKVCFGWKTLHGRGDLFGEIWTKQRYCPIHGHFLPCDILWIVLEDENQPCCPECKSPLIKVGSCPNHGDIRFKDMIWKDLKPFCPKCGISLEIDQ